MKIELTEKKLKVGKWECRSITITQINDYFELVLFDIKGVTKRIPQYLKNGKPKLVRFSQEQEYKILKLTKKIKVKKVEFLGIIPKLSSKNVAFGGVNIQGKEFHYAQNNIKNYINFYKK